MNERLPHDVRTPRPTYGGTAHRAALTDPGSDRRYSETDRDDGRSRPARIGQAFEGGIPGVTVRRTFHGAFSVGRRIAGIPRTGMVKP